MSRKFLNSLKRTLIYIMLLACLFSLMSCHQEEPFVRTGDIVFHIDTLSSSPMSVSLCITHNGSNRDLYYGLLTEDSISNYTAYVRAYIDSAGSAELVKNAWNQRKRVEKLNGLIPSVPYHFIVFAFDSAANLISEPACVDIQTQSNVQFERNLDWRIEWKGEDYYEKSYWTWVRVFFDKPLTDPVYVSLISVEQSNKCGDIKRAIYWLLNEAQNKMEQGEDWYSNTSISRTNIEYHFQRTEGDYYVLLIGVKPDGSPTGQYAISEKNHIGEYTALFEYKSLIGLWTLYDATGNEQTISIQKNIVNKSLSITGWAGKQWPVIVQYDPNANIPFTIDGQRVAEKKSFTSSDGKDFLADVYLWGWYMKTDGSTYRMTDRTEFAYVKKQSDDCYFIDKAFFYNGTDISAFGFRYYLMDCSDNKVAGWVEGSTYTYPITLKRKK